ncbi:MAG TPA: hypothetical protein VHV52_12260 [Gaiellaceae bacterium]|jgi:hypothetical protein|nr:hypothetical protein [Gaiellaceae bacterium]
MKKLASRLLVVAGGICMTLSVSGCFSIPRAAHVEVQVQDGSVTLLKPVGGLQHSGETVLKIDNYSERPINMVLAETTLPPSQMPAKLVDANTPRDDSRIVGITSRVDKVGVAYEFGAIPQAAPKVATLHVYLKPGKRYVLFDKLDEGYKHGVTIVLVAPRSK